MGVVKIIAKVLVLLLCCALVYSLAMVFFYRDLSVAELKARYDYSGLNSVNVDGVNLYYQVDGADDAPVVLLLHSHYFTMRTWDQWVQPLASEFRVIRFDMTSHGLTGPDPKDDYSMSRSQTLINGLLEHLNVQNLTIVGSSLGGNMAFTFAANQPQRVDKLVLINSGGLKRKNARSGTIPKWVDSVFYLLPRTAYRSLLEWMIVDDELVTPEMVAEFHNMFRRRGNRVAELNRLRSFQIGNPDVVLVKVTAPTLLMWGEDNPQLPVELVERFREKLTNSEKVTVLTYSNVGHVIPLEMPETGVRDLIEFLQYQN